MSDTVETRVNVILDAETQRRIVELSRFFPPDRRGGRGKGVNRSKVIRYAVRMLHAQLIEEKQPAPAALK